MARGFDKTNPDPNIATGLVWDFGASGTACVWVKSTGTHAAGTDEFFGTTTGSGSSFALDLITAGNIRCRCRMGGTNRVAQSGSGFNDGEWHFVVADFTEGVSASVNLYIDDMSSTAASTSGNFGSFDAAVDVLDFATNETNADIAYGSVYTGILTEEQRLLAKWGQIADPANCDGFWPLWGGDPEIDLSGNGNHATVNQSPTVVDGPPVGRFVKMPTPAAVVATSAPTIDEIGAQFYLMNGPGFIQRAGGLLHNA